MLGKPGFNEWCRNGYCSQECYERRDPSLLPPDLPPGLTETTPDTRPPAQAVAPAPLAPPPLRPRPLPRDPQCYGLAKFCFLTVPIYMGLAMIGNAGGLQKHPQLASYYLLVVGGIILPAGLLSGIIALVAIREHGPRGLLWRSIIGITLILGFVSLGVASYLDRKNNPRPAREPAASPASR